MAEQQDHKEGHRSRLRARFLASLQKDRAENLPDYEIIEMLLFAAKPRGDVKPLAKALLSKFGSYAKVIAADETALLQVKGMGEAAIASLKIAHISALRLLKEEMQQKPVVSSWQALLDFCQATLAHEKKEHFMLLYLDKKNQVMCHEMQQEGTVDHTPIYPREVVKRALELGASAVILVHNHPSGDCTPSQADIQMTQKVIQALAGVDIQMHDHLIIAGQQHYSFAANGLL